MSAPCICPHCGFNLLPEVEVQDGPWRYEARAGLFYDGMPVQLPPSARMLVGALMRASGRVLSKDALLGVVGSEDALSNMISVYITRARHAFHAIGAPCPIENVWGQGFRWDSGVDHTPRNPQNPSRHDAHTLNAQGSGEGAFVFDHGQPISRKGTQDHV